MPFRIGTYVQRDGRTVRVASVNTTADDSLGALAVSAIGSSGRAAMEQVASAAWGRPQYVLTNESRREAVVLAPGASASSSAIVLPGAWRFAGTTTLRTGTEWALQMSDGWTRDAKLVVIDWVPFGRSHASIPAAVVPDDRVRTGP